MTRNDSVRSADPDDVSAAFGRSTDRPVDRPAERAASVAEAIGAARAAAAAGDVVLVTGSLFTVADAKRALAVGGRPLH